MPLTTDMTTISVVVAMTTPSNVRKDRSLWLRSASSAIQKASRAVTQMVAPRARRGGCGMVVTVPPRCLGASCLPCLSLHEVIIPSGSTQPRRFRFRGRRGSTIPKRCRFDCFGGADPLVRAGPPGPARRSKIKRLRRRDRPTGASAADPGVRPTNYARRRRAIALRVLIRR